MRDIKQNNWKKNKTPKISRRKEIINVRAEINTKEMKETVVNGRESE